MILAMVLVALLIVMLLGAALANAFIARRQLVRHSEQQQQAFWLAESAMQRAVYRLANDPEYQGETWQVPADDLGGTYVGVAIIQVDAIAEADTERRITVEATYPSNALKKNVQHRELLVGKSNELPR
jgi:type II secretory pathway pseudopilin PulG